MQQIQRLREIESQCREGEPLEPETATWFADSLSAFLNKQVTSLEEALGLKMGRGGVPWWREEAIRQRDAALRGLRGEHFSALSVNAAAREICRLAKRYAGCAWPHDRDESELPQRHLGKPQEWLWRAFVSGATMPLGERQLRSILAG